MGRSEEAVASYGAAVRAGPSLARAHHSRAGVPAAMGRSREALGAYDAAIGLGGPAADAYADHGDGRPAARARAEGRRCGARPPLVGAGEEEGEKREGEKEKKAAAAASVQAPVQASIEDPVEAIRAALGGGDVDVDARVNDIPEDPAKPFSIRLPKKGVFGPSAKIRAIKNAPCRIPVRRNREAPRDDGIEASEGQAGKIVTNAGPAPGTGLEAPIAMLATAAVVHPDKTSAGWTTGCGACGRSSAPCARSPRTGSAPTGTTPSSGGYRGPGTG